MIYRKLDSVLEVDKIIGFMGNFILNNNMGRIIHRSASVLKKIIATALLCGSWMNVHALTITAENGTVCPHEGVILHAKDASTTSVVWQKYEGGKWINASEDGSQLLVNVPFIYEMDDHDVTFRAVEKSGLTVANVSNELKITKGTNCVPECHSSSTGDFISGTDFDPTGANSGKLENDVENFFGEYTLEFSKGQVSYTIGGLKNSFGNYVPSIDKKVMEGTEGGYDNYFMNLKNPNGTVVKISFPANPSQCDNGYNHHNVSYRRQNYRFVMRAYVKPTCNIDQNSAFRARTGHGTVTEDRMDVELYDDETGALLGSLSDLKSQNDVAEVKFSSLTNVGNLPMSGGQYHMLRFEITFYGYMPYVNEGLSHYTFTPEFAQLSCADIAIDYISAEVEKVCLSPKMVCKGETVHATATGFPKNASYKWYEYDEKRENWYELMGMSGQGDKYRTADIKVDFVGSREYQVVVNKNDGTNTTVTKKFTVYGKECDPVMPTEIFGDDLICAPNSEKSYYVDPVSEDPTINYRWKLITPSNKIIENSTVYQGSGEGMVSDSKGAKVLVILPSNSENGRYKLQAQVIRVGVVDGKQVTDLIGLPIEKTIDVHNTPKIDLSLTGNFETGLLENDKKLCPADVTTKIVANANISNKEAGKNYIYTWTGANASTKSSSTATVSWDRVAACDGSLTSHKVSVIAEIDGIGCPSSANNTYKFETPVDPTIDCSKINGSEYVLGETEKTKTIDLPLPIYSASCDPDPKMSIEVTVKDLDGKVLSGTNQSRPITFSMSQAATINKKVVAPAGTIELTYTITDGCGKSISCDAVVTVKDETAPNVNCDLIKDRTAHLKNQKGCVAVPGDYPSELPTLTAPRLEDLNKVDGFITGEYIGRREQEGRPSENESSFSKKNDLNDPYKKGVTWILWKFSDKSGNSKYCLQKITVIDDKKPNVTCPTIDDLGTLDVDTLTCTLKPSSVIAKIQEVSKLPYGFDECSSTPEDTLVPTLYYRIPKEGDDLYEIKKSQMNDPIFETGIKYELVWVFKKFTGAYVDETVSVECSVSFMAEDQDAPEFDCSSLRNIMVYPNFVTTATEVKYDPYASAMGQTTDDPGKEYTLKKYFDDGSLSMHTDVEDMCGGPVTIDITITAPDGKKTVIKTLDQFKKFKFEADKDVKKSKVYTITYKFTDARFNSKTCEQTVTVVRNAPPVPDCNTAPLTLYTDEKCQAIYNVKLDEIPTASVQYYLTTKYGDCKGRPGVTDCKKYDAVKTTPGPGGRPVTFDGLNAISGSRTGFRTAIVYPDSVRLYDANGVVTTIENPKEGDDDRVATKDIVFASQQGPDKCPCDSMHAVYATANLTNFETVPSIVKNYNLPVGINKYVWYFSNTFDKTDPAAQVLVDSCVITIEVKDTIAPTLKCGPWEGTSKFYADQSCELSQAQVKVVKPTLEQLEAKDNCTATDDLKLSWVRTFKGKKSTDLAAPYKVGETTIDWIVTDESGNSDTCTQYIQVIDTLGPPVDCETVTPPLTAYVDANCIAEADVVIKAGLQIPEIADDPCSPTGSTIKGVGVRSDGEDVMTAPYKKGVTTITWTFTDAAGASSVCKQKITVLDSVKPTFDCSEILDTTVALAPDQCELNLEEVLAALGSHTAIDNCDGDIKGVPMLRDEDEVTEIPLKEPFKSLRKDTTYHFIWHFVDKAGNDKTCEQYLTIADTTPPDASEACKNLTDKDVLANNTCELPFESIDVDLNSTIEDLCDGTIKAKVQAFVKNYDGKIVRYDDEAIKNVMFPVGTHKFLYIYTDHANLSDTCVMYRTVKDGTKPEILDCFDGKDTVMGNVSSDVCGLTYEDLKDLIILPKAYDECDNLTNGGDILFIDPVVKRYFLNIETNKFDLVVDGNDNEEWKVEAFPVGLTKLKFIFSDQSGNVDSCIKYVNVIDGRGPSFDCSKIDPNPYYPVADPGECTVVVGDIWDILNGDYVATRSCTDETIPGVLTLYGTDKRIPEDYVFEVGRDYHLLWVFRSKIDGKVKTCDQIIRPNHQNPLEPNCENAADIDTIKATEGRCDVPGDSVITKFPYGIDVCTKDTIWGVPHRSDSLEISDPFPTGHTHITWTMVSPYNVEDTAKCEQDINIKGNKKFEINCEELTPAMHKIVAGCDSVSLADTLEIPYADDPCADPDSSYFKRPGEGTRSDDAKLDPISDKYPLGPTWIKWIFTDFTGSVKDSCDQLVDVRTTELLKVNCDSINKDTVNIPVAEGECSVPAAQVKDSLVKRGYPVALHPCGLGEFVGTPTRPNGLTMDDPFFVGPNEIIWVFIDSTTHTLVDSVATCTQIVRVGDVNVPPVDCSQMPDTSIVLPPYDCDIEFKELGLNIKPVYDLCSGAHIDSVVTRSSLPGQSSANGDDILGVPFGVGVDTVYWKYDFGSYNFLCTQVITVKDSMEPVVDCDTILDENIVLPEGICDITKDMVLDSIKQPYANEYCSGLEIKGVPQLMTITTDGDTTYSALPTKFEVGEPYKISWLFELDSLTVLSKRCDIDLTIKSSTKPIFDCSVFNDTVKKYAVGECDVVLDDQILPIQEGKDACVKDYIVYGKAYRVDTVDSKPTYTLLAEMNEGTPSYKVEKLEVGVYHIAWVFESKYSTATDTCNEVLNILTDKRIDISCVELPSFPPTSDDSCSISVALDVPVAVNPCTNEIILPDTVFRSDKVPFKGVDDTFYVGVTTVYWVYIDHSKTLKDSIDTCSQIVQVGDIKDPVIKCPKDTLVTLPIAVCQLDPEDILLNDSLPYFRDYCADTIVPLLKVWRASGKEITEKFDLGIDTVFRRYIYHGVEYICEQQIKVRNAGIDSFNCTLLGEKDTITVELKTAADEVPFSEVERMGFIVPDFSLLNACGQLDTAFTRSDNKQLRDPYPLGLTTITLVVKDTTPGSEETKTCDRVVNVINTGAPGMNCPPLDDRKYICHNDLPSSYKTFEEFIAAGGKFLAQDGTLAPELVDPSSFKVDSVILDATNNKVSTVILCEYTLIRKYSAVDLRKQEVTPCSDTFRVKDDVPPVWLEDAVSTIDTFVCTPTEPFANSAIKAKDNCWDVIYDNPIAKAAGIDLKSGIFFSDSTNRSNDPSKCEYYNYDVVRRFVAYDACNNHSDTIKYLRVVRDTVPPIVNVPKWFQDTVIQADYARPCIFLVPDVDKLLPVDIVSDNCDPNAVEHYKHTQIPPAGDTLKTEAGYLDVKIIFEDPCGLQDSMIKRVEVPTRKSVVSISMVNDTLCADPRMTVKSNEITNYSGRFWGLDPFTHKYGWQTTKSVVFDYYRDTLCLEGLIFSNDKSTNAWRFDQKQESEILALNSHKKTGVYYVVITDTVRLCRDTAHAYIEVHDKPSVYLTSDHYTICEDDSLPLISGEESLYDRFSVYTYDNGAPITKEGWMINGQEYEAGAEIPYSNYPLSLRYYAENECGRDSSWDGVYVHTLSKMSPDNFMLVTNPQNKPRVFRNENAELTLVTKYRPYEYHWYKVNGAFDGRFEEVFDKFGEIKDEYKDLILEPDSLLEIKYSNEIDHNKYELIGLQDTASYYVLMIDSVCPAVPSNVVAIDVVKDIPTAFTPMNSIGMNDTFMEGYDVIIFNRYGQKMVESHNGWDGKLRGEYVDPGVYFYEITLKNLEKHKGTIEVVYFK